MMKQAVSETGPKQIPPLLLSLYYIKTKSRITSTRPSPYCTGGTNSSSFFTFPARPDFSNHLIAFSPPSKLSSVTPGLAIL